MCWGYAVIKYFIRQLNQSIGKSSNESRVYCFVSSVKNAFVEHTSSQLTFTFSAPGGFRKSPLKIHQSYSPPAKYFPWNQSSCSKVLLNINAYTYGVFTVLYRLQLIAWCRNKSYLQIPLTRRTINKRFSAFPPLPPGRGKSDFFLDLEIINFAVRKSWLEWSWSIV